MRTNNKISCNSFFIKDEKLLSLNAVTGLYALYFVFSLFVLSLVSIVLIFGAETEWLSDIAAVMLSVVVFFTAFALLYATAKIIE